MGVDVLDIRKEGNAVRNVMTPPAHQECTKRDRRVWRPVDAVSYAV